MAGSKQVSKRAQATLQRRAMFGALRSAASFDCACTESAYSSNVRVTEVNSSTVVAGCTTPACSNAASAAAAADDGAPDTQLASSCCSR
jgi:hypothetical protein